MTISFAPLEGITGWVYRQVHHDMFPGVDTYYTPFLSPTADCALAGRGAADVLPEHNQGLPVIPQLLTNKAPDFLAAARALADLGYQEVNLNLGCPSGTVVAKKKGSGFLALPDQLDRFFDQVFSQLEGISLSVKTRIGVEDPQEWPALLDIFSRYPIRALILHPRVRRDFYREPVRREAVSYALSHTHLPLCYNGDLFTPGDCRDFSTCFPAVQGLMVGRGLVANPALVRQVQGGPALTKEELRQFHDRLLAGYRDTLSGDWPVLGKMKELWTYFACLFPAPERYTKAMRKAKQLGPYLDAVQALFQDQDLLPNGCFVPPQNRV